MLPKVKRLTTEMFGNIIEKGQSFHRPFFIVKIVKTDSISRFAISIPKKIAKTAVLRNNLKRRIYSIIKNLESKIQNGFKVIIIAKIGVEKLSFKDISLEIREIFVKSGLLK